MSQKWIRSQRWDDEHIPKGMWPVKLVLRAFSSIPLAVVLLLCVAMYGVLASVPIGMLAEIPTYLLVALLAVVMVGAAAAGPLYVLARALKSARRETRFVVMFAAGAALAGGGMWLFAQFVWPSMRYDPAAGRGFMMFADFVRANRAMTLRRLPGMEMSENEFYAWWPLRVILLMFVVNMVVATVRRIEFVFPNTGVLMVHGGIVLIALGSVYYQGNKLEGDMLLQAGALTAQGRPGPGPIENAFYDRTQPVLWLANGDRQEQRSLSGLPRYNDYGLDAVGGGMESAGRRLRRSVPASARINTSVPGIGLDDVRVEIVGYASYANLEETWVSSPGAAGGPAMRIVELVSSAPRAGGGGSVGLVAEDPRSRWGMIGGGIAVEYTRGMSEQRWGDLTTALPRGSEHALIVEVPAAGFKGVYAAQVGAKIEVGKTGYVLEVRQLEAHPPMQIVTPGYEGADSSLAVVHVVPPGGGGGGAFDRWAYHRFPELSQDLLDEKNEGGMPKRRPADASIRIAYIDASQLQVYVDELAGGGDTMRAVYRVPGFIGGAGASGADGAAGGGESAPMIVADLRSGASIQLVPMFALKVGARQNNAVKIEVPRIVPEAQRNRDLIGNHLSAAVAVRLSMDVASGAAQNWSTVFWVPFADYPEVSGDKLRGVGLPDGRQVSVMFGRERHELPGLALQLADFEMIPYPHSDTPRDYRSEVTVYRLWRSERDETRQATSLNYPLKTGPFFWSSARSWFTNAADWLGMKLGPMQFKFSQAGWDAAGWQQAKQTVPAGQKPYARYTILGVGNSPGIYVIAGGALLMSLGIPWAFYVKPVIMRARKRKIQRELGIEERGEKPEAKARPGKKREPVTAS